MIGKILTAAGFILILAGSLGAEPFKSSPLIQRESSVFRCRYEDPNISFEGKALGIQMLDRESAEEIDQAVERYQEDGQRYFRIRTKNKNRNSNTVNATTILTDKGELIWQSTNFMVTNASGKELSRGSFYDPRDPSYGFPDDIYGVNVLLMLFRGMRLEKGYQQYFHLWLPGNILRMRAKVEGIEEVKVPAGTFQCYKVVITPMIAEFFGKIIGRVVQRFFALNYSFWLDTRGSHPCVKYRGPLGASSVRLPMVIHELISYSQEPSEQPGSEPESP